MYDFVEKSMQSELWQVYKTIRSLIQHSMESQPQNPEFKNNPENFHP